MWSSQSTGRVLLLPVCLVPFSFEYDSRWNGWAISSNCDNNSCILAFSPSLLILNFLSPTNHSLCRWTYFWLDSNLINSPEALRSNRLTIITHLQHLAQQIKPSFICCWIDSTFSDGFKWVGIVCSPVFACMTWFTCSLQHLFHFDLLMGSTYAWGMFAYLGSLILNPVSYLQAIEGLRNLSSYIYRYNTVYS